MKVSDVGTLPDQIALVTGATAYIGRAVANELARRGATVVVNGRSADSRAAVVEEIRAAGGRAEFECATSPSALRCRPWSIASCNATAGSTCWWPAAPAPAVIRWPSSCSWKWKARTSRPISAPTGSRARTRSRRRHWPCANGAAARSWRSADGGRVATVGESFMGGATGGMMQMCRVLARELGRDGIRINAVAMSYIWDASRDGVAGRPRWPARTARA